MARDNFVVDHLKLLWILIRWPFVVLFKTFSFLWEQEKDVSKVCHVHCARSRRAHARRKSC